MSQGDNSDEAGKLFVGGIARQTSEDALRKYFEVYGEVSDCVLMKDSETGYSRGFGFVTYKDPNCIQTVLKARPHTLDNKMIDPKPCTPRHIQQQKKQSANQFSRAHKIFVGGISMETTEDEVREYFGKYGVVIEVVFVVNKQDTSKPHKGFGFVTFEDASSVDQALAKHYHIIKNKKVEAKKAESRERMDAMKGEQQHHPQPPQSQQQGGGYNNMGYNQGGYNQGGYNQGGNQMGSGPGMGYNQGMNQGPGNWMPNQMMGGYGYGNQNFSTGYPQQYNGNQGYGYGYPGNFSGPNPQMGGNMGNMQGGNMQGYGNPGMMGGGMSNNMGPRGPSGPGGPNGGPSGPGGMHGGGGQGNMGGYPTNQQGYGNMGPSGGGGTGGGGYNSMSGGSGSRSGNMGPGNNNMGPHNTNNAGSQGSGSGGGSGYGPTKATGGGSQSYHPYRR